MITFIAGVLAGWTALAVGVVALVWKAIARAPKPVTQPAGVVDPETQQLWDEYGVIVGAEWAL